MNDSTPERQHDHESSDALRKGVSRRRFIQKISALGLASFGASAVLAGCDGANSIECDVSGLSPNEKRRRDVQVEALNYIEQTEDPNENCANCFFYQEPTVDSTCGGCTLFPGPVNPNGWCSTWQAKAG